MSLRVLTFVGRHGGWWMQGQNSDLRRGMILEHQLLLAQSMTSFVKENKNDKRWT